MDTHAFVSTHMQSWRRLENLVSRRRTLHDQEIEELIRLYHDTSTHLCMLQSVSHDRSMMSYLSVLIAQARHAISSSPSRFLRVLAQFWMVDFPLAAYKCRWWWLGAGVFTVAVAIISGWWIDHSAVARQSIGPNALIDTLVNDSFVNFYYEHQASAFATQVWLNNSIVAAKCVGMAALLGIPIPYVLYLNGLNIGVVGGLMFHADRGDIFLSLITPHGLLELTATFLAAGAGMRLGWTVISPGPLRRFQALAIEGRSLIVIALGLVFVLLIAGLIEAFVTPSSLFNWLRLLIGVSAFLIFLAYCGVLGRRAMNNGLSGDMELARDYAPSV